MIVIIFVLSIDLEQALGKGKMILYAVLSCLFTVTLAADNIFKHCDYVEHLDCSTYSQTQVCGSDGLTYNGKCELAVAHCKNDQIHHSHNGPCSHVHTTTAPVSGTTPNLVQGVFCQAVHHVDCSNHHKETICGSNGKTYESMCVYEKARCHDKTLHLATC